MQEGAPGPARSCLLFETPVEMCARIFRDLRPRTRPPEIRIEFRPFANANSSVSLDASGLRLRISDLLEGAPAPVLEALLYILLAKLFRKPAPKIYAYRYRLYLNRKDVRRRMHLVRQVRGRKFVSGPQGRFFNLDELFERLNACYFDGLLGRPLLGWSRTSSRSLLGHFDPSHNAIVISRLFDRPGIDPLALEYVLFHEMLHLRYPVDHAGVKRRVHTREFREAEKRFPRFKEAKELLAKL
jgi:hypothetical protein